MIFTPETFRRVSDGLCGNCAGALRHHPTVPYDGHCINCDFYWRCGTDPEVDAVWVERRQSPEGFYLRYGFHRIQVETYRG
jgi:hypothetical protein